MRRFTNGLSAVLLVLGGAGTAHGEDGCDHAWNVEIGQPGMPQSVQATKVFDDGTRGGPVLYAGGAFTTAGGHAAAHVARWNGLGWSPVGEGFDGAVMGFLSFDLDGQGTTLVATGEFTASGSTTVNHVARWTGSEWQPIGSGLGGAGRVFAVYDDGSGEQLYVGGDFLSNGDSTTVRRIAYWDGVRWTEVGGGLISGPAPSVQDMAVFNDGNGPALYVGGNFISAGGMEVSNIARWDGETWSSPGGGVAGSTGSNIQAMAVFDDGSGPALYVGGLFTEAGGEEIPKLARWDGESWSAVGDGISTGLFGVTDILVDQEAGKMYITGSIQTAGKHNVQNLAVWDGESWSGIEAGGLGGSLFPTGLTMELDDIGFGRSLFVGGTFTNAGGQQSERIAELALELPPLITQQPEDHEAVYGEDAILTVNAENAKAFQWRFNGQPLKDGDGLKGAQTPTLSIQDLTFADEGLYDVRVSNDCDEVISDAAELIVNPKPGDLNKDGVVNVLDLLILLQQWGPCADPDDCPADLNGDGSVNVVDLLILLENWG